MSGAGPHYRSEWAAIRPRSRIKSPAVPLSLAHRRVGDVYVVTCAGRIVEGPESGALRELLDGLLPFGSFLILHVGAVDFVDSSGLGLLVRYATRLRHANGKLTLCAPSPKMRALLATTHLTDVFDLGESEEAAIQASHTHTSTAGAPAIGPDVLCVTGSIDVQAYLRELIGHAGYRVLTAGNIPDAAILLQARRPPLVVVASELRRVQGTAAAEKFRRLVEAASVIELPQDFSHRDAAGAGAVLLDQIRALSPLA
jgi:anti-sigma B factor antagonist